MGQKNSIEAHQGKDFSHMWRGIRDREAMAGLASFPIERDEGCYAGGIDAFYGAEIERHALTPDQGGEVGQQAFFAAPDKFGQSDGGKCDGVIRNGDGGGHDETSLGEAGFRQGVCLRPLLHLLFKEARGRPKSWNGNMLKLQGIGAIPKSGPRFRVFNRGFQRPQTNT